MNCALVEALDEGRGRNELRPYTSFEPERSIIPLTQ